MLRSYGPSFRRAVFAALLFVSLLPAYPALGQTAQVPKGLIGTWRGPDGKPFSFNGSNPIQVQDSPAFDLPDNSSWTLEAWVFPTTNDPRGHIVGKRGVCGAGSNFYQISIDHNAPGTGMGIDPQYTPMNTWTHVVLAATAGKGWEVYANGLLVKTVAAPRWRIRNSGHLMIGGSGTCRGFTGQIAEVSLYNRALTPAEIQKIYQATRALVTSIQQAQSAPPAVPAQSHPDLASVRDDPAAIVPSAMAQCEADQCTRGGGGGIWIFQGRKGMAVWRFGAIADLTVEKFDGHTIVIHREDPNPSYSSPRFADLKKRPDGVFFADYIGTVQGNRIDGTVSWNGGGQGTWFALLPATLCNPMSQCPLSVDQVRVLQRRALAANLFQAAAICARITGDQIVAQEQPVQSNPPRVEAQQVAPVAPTKPIPIPQAPKVETPKQTAPTTDLTNGSYYALLIGINQYHPPLPNLQTAVGDAQAIARVLSERYGFQVKLLLNENATRANILDTLNQFRRSLRENDNLLVYYAGHGHSDREADKAYWLPADADADRPSSWIMADDLTTEIRVQPARHVLVVSDSCYSGDLTRGALIPNRPNDPQVFLRKMLAAKSRTLMASGGDEPVTDRGPGGHSVFASALLNGLENADQTSFTAEDLFYGSIRQQVAGKSDQIPRYAPIRNSDHDSGDFVFIRP
jgi:hypothetical protein